MVGFMINKKPHLLLESIQHKDEVLNRSYFILSLNTNIYNLVELQMFP
jgi:hypothetical protein